MSISTHTFQVEGMHCGSCGLLIDDTLADLPGVEDTQTSAKQGRSVVRLDTTQTTTAEVTAAIAELGYRATPLTQQAAVSPASSDTPSTP